MLYEINHPQGVLLPEIAQLLRLMDVKTSQTQPNEANNGTFPKVNTGISKESIDVYASVAGANPESFEVTVENNTLSITGKREAFGSTNENQKIHLNEISSGQFKRSITLPDDVDTEHVKADYRNGILHVNIKRKEQEKARHISVSTH